MGFRIIRESAENYAEKLSELKKLALESEAQKWGFLTFKDEQNKLTFLDRFQTIKAEDKKEISDVKEQILRSGANIAKIQGNLKIENLAALLPTLTLDRVAPPKI